MKYIEGDLFNHVPNDSDEVVIIAHVCNDIGAWGAGFVVPLGRKYPSARESYMSMTERNLGEVMFVPMAEKVVVANMIGQEGVGPKFDGNKMIPPIRYDALKQCMHHVHDMAKLLQQQGKKVRIACPMFGAGLAGGDWNTIAIMIGLIWSEMGIETNIYYLPQFLPPGFTPPGADNGKQEVPA
jgi:O-acetyl-ADP-ribose deacetylase (regulator of RNase III)